MGMSRLPAVDLINQRQVLVAFGVFDFIHTDGVDLAERAVFQAARAAG